MASLRNLYTDIARQDITHNLYTHVIFISKPLMSTIPSKKTPQELLPY